MTIFYSTTSKNIIILGGAASMMLNFREDLIKDLVSNGHQVYCLAQKYSPQDKEIIAGWGAVAVDSPLNSKGLNPFSDMLSVLRLRKIFKEISPDVVFSYFVKPVIFGCFAGRLAKVPRIVGMIEGLGNSFTIHKHKMSKKTWIIKMIQVLLYKSSLPYLSHLILLNKDDKKDLIDRYRIPVKKLDILGGIGVDLSKFSYQPSNEEEISFIFIARLLKEKGIFDYLQAAEIIKHKFPQVTFYVLGEFDTENPFALKRAQLDDFLQRDTITYPGYVSNVSDWIARSSVFVLPSYREGFPRSIQEAMAIGRPVITTDSVGCRETVKNGINGFLIPPFSPHALAEKMQYFIENPQQINEMGLKSRKIAEEKYNVHTVNHRLKSILLGGLG